MPRANVERGDAFGTFRAEEATLAPSYRPGHCGVPKWTIASVEPRKEVAAALLCRT